MKITPVHTIECNGGYGYEVDWFRDDPLKIEKDDLDTIAKWMLRGLMLPDLMCKLVLFDTKKGRIIWQSEELTDMDRAKAFWAFVNYNTDDFPVSEVAA